MGSASGHRIHPIVEAGVQRIVERAGAAISDLSGRTVVVTGAAGFLPSYFVDALARANAHALDEPCSIVCVDNMIDGPPERLAHLEGRDDVRFVRADVSEDARDRRRVDYVAPRRQHRLADLVPALSARDDRRQRHRHAEPASSSRGETRRTAPLPQLERDLRRSAGRPDPDARGVLGPRVGDGAAGAVRRVEAAGRDAVRDVPPRHGTPVEDRPALQRLRAAPAARRRPRRPRLPLATRWQASRSALLQRRPRRRAASATSRTSSPRSSSCSSPGRAGEAYNVGNDEEVTHAGGRPSSWPRSPERSRRRDRSQRRSRVPDRQPSRRCPDLTKTKAAIDWEPRVALREGFARTLAYYRRRGSRMNVAVVGCGYVGLVTGLGLAPRRPRVVGIEVDAGRREQIGSRASRRSTSLGWTSCSAVRLDSGSFRASRLTCLPPPTPTSCSSPCRHRRARTAPSTWLPPRRRAASSRACSRRGGGGRWSRPQHGRPGHGGTGRRADSRRAWRRSPSNPEFLARGVRGRRLPRRRPDRRRLRRPGRPRAPHRPLQPLGRRSSSPHPRPPSSPSTRRTRSSRRWSPSRTRSPASASRCPAWTWRTCSASSTATAG